MRIAPAIVLLLSLVLGLSLAACAPPTPKVNPGASHAIENGAFMAMNGRDATFRQRELDSLSCHG